MTQKDKKSKLILTDEEVRRRITSRNKAYWDNRSVLRHLEVEGLIGGYEDVIRRAYDDMNEQIRRTTMGLLDDFKKKLEKTTGETLNRREVKEFLTGTLSATDKERLRRGLASNGIDFDQMFNQYTYKGKQIQRQDFLKEYIDTNVKRLSETEVDLQTLAYREMLEFSHDMNMYDLSVRTGFDLGHYTTTARDINNIIQADWSGELFSKRVWHNNALMGDMLKSLFMQRELTGVSTREIIDQMDVIYHKGKYASARLIRTETNAMRTMSEKVEAEVLGIDRYLLIATLDNRTSAICQYEDGKVYLWRDMQIGVNAPPFHPNCRTIASDFLEGMDLSKMKRIARNPYTGETEYVPADLTYKEWKDNHVKNIPEGYKQIEVPKPKIKPITEVKKEINMEDLRAKVDNNIKQTNVASAFSNKKQKELLENLESINDTDVLQMYSEFGDQLEFKKIANTSNAYYSPYYDLVHVNNVDFVGGKGDNGVTNFSVVHHEVGHAFDFNAMKTLKGSKVYSTEIDSTIMIDGKEEAITKRVRLRHVSQLPEYDLGNKIKEDLWNFVGGTGDVPLVGQETTTLQRAKFEKLDKHLLGLKKQFEADGDNYTDLVGVVSDILGATNFTGRNMPYGWGHDADYWLRSGTMETEFFAHMFELRAINPRASKEFDNIFKQSSKAYDQIISDILKGRK